MVVHRFNNSHSEQYFTDALQNSTRVAVNDGLPKKLRITQTSLKNAVLVQQNPSFACLEIKRHDINDQPTLVMVRYNMTFQNNTDWDQTKVDFERFLARHLGIDRSNVEVLAIASDKDTSYIMNATPALLTAFINGTNYNIKNIVIRGVFFATIAAIMVVILKPRH